MTTSPASVKRQVFGGVVGGRPVTPAEIELPKVRDALSMLLAIVHEHGEGPWSTNAYWDNRRRLASAPDVDSLRALAVEILRPHGWSDDDLRQAGVLAALPPAPMRRVHY
jgi:hypothetical protein